MLHKTIFILLLCLFTGQLIGAEEAPHPGLLDPSKAAEKAPDTFRVKVETTKGDFEIQVTRAWAPLGADRFYNLVKIGYFKDIAFYRVIYGFVVQFGYSGDPKINNAWDSQLLKDDPKKQSNTIGRVVFASRGPDTRTTQFFINTGDNYNLDTMGFTPFGEVIGDGLDIVRKFFGGYGEGPPRGRGPNQMRIKLEGLDYLKEGYPMLDYIKSATIIK